MRKLVVLAVLLLISTSHAQADAHRGWRLALDVALLSVQRDDSESYSAAQNTLQVGAAQTFAPRVGYLFPRGWELGLVCDLGVVHAKADQDVYTGMRATPDAYVRYLFPGDRLRPYLGGSFGGEFLRARSRHTEFANDYDYTLTDSVGRVHGRGFGFGVEGGLRLLATRWLSLDPFVRFQVSRSDITFSDDAAPSYTLGSWRLLFGFATSFWL